MTREAAMLILSGLPGTGKTTFAVALAARAPVVHLESDAIRRDVRNAREAWKCEGNRNGR